ncbi:MAG TPA: sulfatase-like hydrolase/transferase, partial [Trebonia sp.]
GLPANPSFNVPNTNPPGWLQVHQPLGAKEIKQLNDSFNLRVEAVQAVDRMIGDMMAKLAQSGLDKNTYIVFSSDNGYHMGEYRLNPGKQTAFDTDINVPLIVSGPGVPAGRTAPQLASNIDLNPTLLTLAGLPVPATVDGHSLAGIWHGQNPAGWRQAILIEHHGPDNIPGDPDRQDRASGIPPSYEAVRTAAALYVAYDNGDREYYDTTTDPYELDNIVSHGVPGNLGSALKAMENCHSGAACWAAAHLSNP